MALTNVIGRCKRHDGIDAVPLFQHILCVNSLFVCKCGRLDNFSTRDREKMNVNTCISNEFNFSDVHGAMNIRKIKLIAYIYIHFSPALVEKFISYSNFFSP